MQSLKKILFVALWGIHAGLTPAEGAAVGQPRLYIAEQGIPFGPQGRILTMTTGGGNVQTRIPDLDNAPDGLVVDEEAGFIYFSQMGSNIFPNSMNGTIERVRIDGTERTILVGGGQTHVPKQLILTEIAGQKKLYWGDREGMKVMRSNPDGSEVEVVVDTSRTGSGSSDSKMVVGVAVDPANGWLYWTQKGGKKTSDGSVHRTRLDPARNATGCQPVDDQVLVQGLPEPIDLHLRASSQTLYWTERGGEGSGNVNSILVGSGPTVTAAAKYVVKGVGRAVGITVDEDRQTLFFGTLGGEVYSCGLDGSSKTLIKDGLGLLTGMYFL